MAAVFVGAVARRGRRAAGRAWGWFSRPGATLVGRVRKRLADACESAWRVRVAPVGAWLRRVVEEDAQLRAIVADLAAPVLAALAAEGEWVAVWGERVARWAHAQAHGWQVWRA